MRRKKKEARATERAIHKRAGEGKKAPHKFSGGHVFEQKSPGDGVRVQTDRLKKKK